MLRRARARARTLELPCIVRVVKDRVQVSLMEYPLPCGHSGYRIDLEYYVEELDRWVEIASLRDFNLDASIALLTEARQCIENLDGPEPPHPRRLPRVSVGGKTYFVDSRLRELRNVDNPHDRVEFSGE